MATSAERMRALRERARRGIRRLTSTPARDDLRTLAERGYEGAASTDHDQPAHAALQAWRRFCYHPLRKRHDRAANAE
jgi:hypothetical protein